MPKWLILSISACLVLYLAMPAIWYCCYVISGLVGVNYNPPPLKYDSQIWNHPISFDCRYRMAKNLVLENSLVGKTRAQIFAIFGPAKTLHVREPVQNRPTGQTCICYCLPSYPDSCGYRYIILTIGDRGVVEKVFWETRHIDFMGRLMLLDLTECEHPSCLDTLSRTFYKLFESENWQSFPRASLDYEHGFI